MGDVVNLRAARKRKARADREREAAGNRAVHGRPKAERLADRANRNGADARLDAHLRERRRDDEA